jgi:PAS domain S-box-containing protein
MVLLDPHKTCLIANAAFAELAGKSIEDIENTKLMETGLPDDLIYRLNGVVDNAIQTGEKYTFETNYGRTTLLIRVEPEYEKTDEIGGISIVFHDITERKRAEEALKESERFLHILLESLPLPVFYKDAEGRYKGFNKAFETFFGRPKSELIDRSVFDINPPELAKIYHAKDSELFKKISTQTYESQVKNAYGKLRDVVFHKATLTNTSGVITGLVGAIMDITDRKQAEQKVVERTDLAETRARQLQALAVDLIEAEEQERQRISDMLHDDLQQMIAGARMQLQAAGNSADPAPVIEKVDQLLEQSIEKSRNLSHQLSPPVLHQFGLIPALDWLARQMEEQFGLQIRLETEAGLKISDSPVKIFLFRAAQELLFNVVKHSEVKNASVLLSRSDSNLVLSISDSGRGFEPAILNQTDQRAGLGLASLRERTLAIGGSIEIDSTPGKGSRFTFKIPLNLIQTKIKKQSRADEPRHLAKENPLAVSKIRRVLLADDHQVVLEGLANLMARIPNIEVVGKAADGKEALEMARRLHPDVVLMDISMPKIDGLEATRLITAELPWIRVIGLSMFADENVSKKMIEAGAKAFVPKSSSSAELLKAIFEVNEEEKD